MKLLHRLKQLIISDAAHLHQRRHLTDRLAHRLTSLKDVFTKQVFGTPLPADGADSNSDSQAADMDDVNTVNLAQAAVDTLANASSNDQVKSVNQLNSQQTHPITDTLTAWISTQGWQYEYKAPTSNEVKVHHLILAFADQVNEWTCVFRINETTHLVSIYGILTETVPPSHYASMLMAMSLANLNIPFGNLELDPHDGEVRCKIALDAEYTPLTADALICHLQGVAGMSELAAKLYHDVMSEEAPSPVILDYLPYIDDEQPSHDASSDGDTQAMHEESDGEKRKFFLATTQYQ